MARFSFWNAYGVGVGLESTDDLRQAVADARNFEHEIYDEELKMFAYRLTEGRFRWDTDWVLAMVERTSKNEKQGN